MLDLLPEHLRRRALFPVGRLDKDTEGLLLLTNDGPLAHALLSRRSGMWTRSTMWRWTAGWTSRTGEALAGGDGPGRRDAVPARRLEPLAVAGPAQPAWSPCREEVPPGEADAGRPREAGDLSQAPVHGAPDPGPGPSGRGLAAVDPEEKAQSWTVGIRNDPYFGIFHKDSRKSY
ncbi:MAG: pseudouridine synthase [Lawsonibacter sp.]